MNLEDELGGERGVRVDELGAGSGKRIVDIARWHARAALHRDPVTLRHKLLDRLRRGGDSRLVRPRFGRHSDMHLYPPHVLILIWGVQSVALLPGSGLCP